MSSSSCSIAFARSSFSMPLREKIFTPTMMPSMPGGQMRLASRTSPAFSPKIARSSFSSGVSCVSPFGDVRDVPGDLFGTELRVAGLDLEFLDVDGRVVVVLHHPLRDENRVLEV